MSWAPVSTEQHELFEQIMLWIRTARAAGKQYALISYGSDWLPSTADFAKSALFERIRSGLAPLDEPPPVGFACPWYAVVEDAGPHWLMEVTPSSFPGEEEMLVINQNGFRIYDRLGDQEFIVGDRRGTSYRFRVWFDADWRHPTLSDHPRFQGGWFIQNTALAAATGTAKTAKLAECEASQSGPQGQRQSQERIGSKLNKRPEQFDDD